MEFNGFRTIKDSAGISVEFTMPLALSGVFSAKMWCRGPVCDAACGSPSETWRLLSGDARPSRLIAPVQVHGTRILDASEASVLPQRDEADGIYLRKTSAALGSLRFADCTPVVLAGFAEEPWLVMLHSGFQGTLRNISRSAADMIFSRYPNQSLDNIWAWIGPAIGPECYSRKKADPTSEKAAQTFAPQNIIDTKDDLQNYYFDIKGEIYSQFCKIGLNHDKIFKYDCCTFCGKDLFYSYRSGDTKNRSFLLAGPVKNLPWM